MRFSSSFASFYFTNGNSISTGILFFFSKKTIHNFSRNDRRIRYITDTYKSLGTKKSNIPIVDSFDNKHETKLNLQHEFSSTGDDEKFILKYLNDKSDSSDHIYSDDPLEHKDFLKSSDDNSAVYEYIDHTIVNLKTSDYNKIN